MNHLNEAVARYQKLIEADPYKDLGWAETLAEKMQAEHLTQGGRLICPFLRPNFITHRQYDTLVKGAEALFSAIDRVKQMALANPALLARLELLPAEKMLASIDPGYPFLAVTSLLDTHLSNGSMYFVEYNADTPLGVAYGEALADLFYDCQPVKEFRKRYALQKLGGKKHLLSALLKAYKQFGGKNQPNIAILEFRQPFQSTEQGEYLLLREFFRAEGYPTEIVSPDQLEYRAGVLRRGNFNLDLIYRRVKVQEFLLRYDLSHPLVRAYREGKVCMVNSFRSELAHKKAIFDLLTDQTITASFPAAETKAIRQYVPWTRMVAMNKTSYQDQTIDLPNFILHNREKLVLKPNDDSGEHHSIRGWETDEAGWERALRKALRLPYVVQEKVDASHATFPLLRYGELEMRQMQVDLHPHAYLGKVLGCSSWLSTGDGGGFSTVAGLAPTFILEPKS
jgi:uncharacterized circularly permuted ATP-grasp superfamily protein